MAFDADEHLGEARAVARFLVVRGHSQKAPMYEFVSGLVVRLTAQLRTAATATTTMPEDRARYELSAAGPETRWRFHFDLTIDPTFAVVDNRGRQRKVVTDQVSLLPDFFAQFSVARNFGARWNQNSPQAASFYILRYGTPAGTILTGDKEAFVNDFALIRMVEGEAIMGIDEA